VLIVIGPLLDQTSLQAGIVTETRNVMGRQGADFIQSLLSGVAEIKFNLTTILISAGTLIAGTLGVFYALKNALDDLWDVNPSLKSTRGWKYFFSSRILSLSMIPILGFLFLISLMFSAILSYLAGYSPLLASMTYLFQVGTIAFTFFLMTFLFAFIYRYLPNRRLPWKELLRGAFITALLFMLGRFVIDFYIARFDVSSVFGAAGAMVVLLLWIYYSAMIFLFGASLTYVYSKRYGKLKN
jgi:membrane protein